MCPVKNLAIVYDQKNREVTIRGSQAALEDLRDTISEALDPRNNVSLEDEYVAYDGTNFSIVVVTERISGADKNKVP